MENSTHNYQDYENLIYGICHKFNPQNDPEHFKELVSEAKIQFYNMQKRKGYKKGKGAFTTILQIGIVNRLRHDYGYSKKNAKYHNHHISSDQTTTVDKNDDSVFYEGSIGTDPERNITEGYLSGTIPNHEKVVEFQEILDGLSDDAKTICEVLFEGWSSEVRSKKTVRKWLFNIFNKNRKWSPDRIALCFQELRDVANYLG